MVTHHNIEQYTCCVCTDRPLPPRNVAVSNIKGESCYLNWDAPLDNGGSELTNYIVEKKEVLLTEEPELEEGQEPPAEPQWLDVNNSIIERRYRVSFPFTCILFIIHKGQSTLIYISVSTSCELANKLMFFFFGQVNNIMHSNVCWQRNFS